MFATPSNALGLFLHMQGFPTFLVAGSFDYNTSHGSKYLKEDSDSSCPCGLVVARSVHKWGMLPLRRLFPWPSEKTNGDHRNCYNLTLSIVSGVQAVYNIVGLSYLLPHTQFHILIHTSFRFTNNPNSRSPNCLHTQLPKHVSHVPSVTKIRPHL